MKSVGEIMINRKTSICAAIALGLAAFLVNPANAKAQAIHQPGVGVVFNDVPDIPFQQELQRLKRK